MARTNPAGGKKGFWKVNYLTPDTKLFYGASLTGILEQNLWAPGTDTDIFWEICIWCVRRFTVINRQ